MVNTRRTSQALQSDESRAQAAEQSDSSTASTARRTTRRSVSNLPSTPAEISTPTRRSRRLSNSSIESANNDTPRPAARRSTRGKAAGSDNETSDVELVVIKRRKLVEGVDTLIPICEEKTEENASSTKGKESHILVELDEEKEEETGQETEIIDVSHENHQDIVFNETSPANCVETKKIKSPVKIETTRSPVKTEDVISPVETEDAVSTVETEDAVSTVETEDAISTVETEDAISTAKMEDVNNLESLLVIERVIEDAGSPKKVAKVGLVIEKADEVDKGNGKSKTVAPTVIVDVSKESLHSIEEHNQENYFTPVSTPTNLEDTEDVTKQAEKIACTTNEKQQLVEMSVESQTTSTENNMEQEEENKPLESCPLKETNAMTAADLPEKPRMLFGVPESKITVNKSLMMKKTGKKSPAERKIRRPRKKIEPAKESLPCGADIMRNIPRGKSKSGREWKEPKSNPRYLYQDKGLKMPFEKITQLRQERQRVKDLENRMKEEERARRAEITRRRAVNKQREEENARRGEVVQVIRNTNKIKRMKKKQLKLIQKRDTTNVV